MTDALIQYGPKQNSKEIENILTHIFNSNIEINEFDKKPSKIIKKEIDVKEMKDAKMVKKFFVWDTNTVSKI